jgi:hypothetical protein
VRALGIALVALGLAASFTMSAARAQLPSSEVPGASPVRKMDQKERADTPAGAQVEPTPGTPDSNLPKPEPVAPRLSPDSPPSLPGSGRKDVIPGN